jgi:osmotically-inducible protein OsmY
MHKVGKRWLTGLLLMAVMGPCGCNHQDADRLARVGRKVAAKFEGVSGGAQEKLADGWQAVRGGWEDVALDARVATRLRWDKALGGTRIEVRATGGVVELRGSVGNDNQRRRAVEVAETTTGVDRVTDGMEVTAQEP